MSRRPQARPRLLSSLRWRLSTAISGLVFLCAAVCVAGAVLFLRQTLTDRATSELQHSIAGVRGFVSNQKGDLRDMARLISTDASIRNSMLHGDRTALILHLKRYYVDLNVDVLDVTDASGKVIVRMENTDRAASGDSIRRRSDVYQALGGNTTVALGADLPNQEAAAGYALRATTPLYSGQRVAGVVIVGRQLDSIYASRLGRAVNADVNLIAGGQRTGSTLTDSHGLTTAGVAASSDLAHRIAAGKTSISTVNENGHTVLSGIVPLTDSDGRYIGAVEVVSRLDPLYELIRQLSFLLIALGAGVVIIGTILALDLARRLTRRLLVLEEAASEVAQIASIDAPLGDLQSKVAVSGDDEVASLARSLSAMMHSLDERMAVNARLYSAAQARVRELTGLAEIARLLTAVPSIRDTLDILGEQVCRLVGCAGVAIWLPGDGEVPALYGGHGLPPEYEGMLRPIIDSTPLDGPQIPSLAAIQTGEVVWQRLDGPASDLPSTQRELRLFAQNADWGSATALPLRVQGRIVGAVTCYTYAVEPLPETDLSLLRTIADQVAVAVENARLYAQSRDVAALEERTRLARELHDSVTQALFSMTLHARAVQMAMQREGVDIDTSIGRGISQLHDLTQGALAEMRALIFELRPGALAEEGLVAALQKHGAAVSAREGLEVVVEAPEERVQLQPAAEEHLYRIAQEALHNVIKHARATRVTVRLIAGDKEWVALEIVDDGRGFDRDNVPPGHLGLGTMAERAESVGATFEMDTAVGRGTTVRVVLRQHILPDRESPLVAISP